MTLFPVPPQQRLPALLVSFMGLLAGCGGGSSPDPVVPPPPPPPPPFSYTEPADIGDGWTTTNAADLGVDVSMLEDMVDRLPQEFDIVDSLANLA